MGGEGIVPIDLTVKRSPGGGLGGVVRVRVVVHEGLPPRLTAGPGLRCPSQGGGLGGSQCPLSQTLGGGGNFRWQRMMLPTQMGESTPVRVSNRPTHSPGARNMVAGQSAGGRGDCPGFLKMMLKDPEARKNGRGAAPGGMQSFFWILKMFGLYPNRDQPRENAVTPCVAQPRKNPALPWCHVGLHDPCFWSPRPPRDPRR